MRNRYRISFWKLKQDTFEAKKKKFINFDLKRPTIFVSDRQSRSFIM